MAKGKFLAPLIEADAKRWASARAKLPEEIAEESVNFFKNNFRRQGFVNAGVTKWKTRKGEKRKTRKTKKTDKESRNILKLTGALEKSIKQQKTTKNKIVIGSTVEYAGVHNYGLRSGRGKGFKMPQRRFIGHSYKLGQNIRKLINKRIERAFRK